MLDPDPYQMNTDPQPWLSPLDFVGQSLWRETTMRAGQAIPVLHVGEEELHRHVELEGVREKDGQRHQDLHQHSQPATYGTSQQNKPL